MPMTSAPEEITLLLNAWAQGDQTAAEKLFPLIERELHKIAHVFMRDQPPGHILQTTALVNEAYLKLAGGKVKSWKDRGHFFAVASMAMRHILVDYARKELREKRGSGKADLPLDEALAVPVQQSSWLLALDDALRSFARLDPRAAQVVELRLFGGLSVEETAEALGVSKATVHNDAKAARLWLTREISGKSDES
jgi:RNA polymerase sigma factor (TIGR02999 family)